MSERVAPQARRVRIQDVAQEAGVSVSAVSKVLRDAYGVSPQMQRRVQETIERMGYRPHAGARAMRGRSHTVGVMLMHLSSPFQPEVVEGISGQLEHSSYQEVLVAAGQSPARQMRSIEALLDRQVDGLILLTPWMKTAWLEDLGERVPIVVIGRHGPGKNYDSVVDDDYLGARLMVSHLVDLGHERIAHTSQPIGGLRRPFVLSHTPRCDGYADAMTEHGLEPQVAVTSYTEPGGHEAAVQLLGQSEPPTAIFAGADIAALGVLRAAEERGVRVPDDLSVTGYDNIYASSIGRVSLTTVDQSGDRTGSISAQLLLERLDGRTEAVHHVLTPRLIPRATSTAPST